MADLASENPKRAILNAAERIRRTVQHVVGTTSDPETRRTFEAIATSIEADVDIIAAAVDTLP